MRAKVEYDCDFERISKRAIQYQAKIVHLFMKIRVGQVINIRYQHKGHKKEDTLFKPIRIIQGKIIQKTPNLLIVQDSERQFLRMSINLSELISQKIAIEKVIPDASIQG